MLRGRPPVADRGKIRRHSAAAETYERVKRSLAALCEDTGTYAAAKDPVCDLVLHAAEGWARRTGWHPG